MHRRFLFAFLAALMSISTSLWALGLGDAKVLSFLNQPLKVHIDLITRSNDDLESVTARLASAEDFAMVGASLNAISVPLDFSIEEDNGNAYILITSDVSVADPLMRIIVEVSWSSGRMLREYTLFLDPPTLESAAPPPLVGRRPLTQPPVSESVPEPVAESVQEPLQDQRSLGSLSDDEYGPVKSGETLWRIAADWANGTDLSVNQVMLALLEKNPRAFLNDNVNLLRQGAVLRMPDIGEVRRMSEAEARNEVRAQTSDFAQRNDSVADDLPLFADESTRAVDDTLGEVEASAEGRLELVPSAETDPDSDTENDTISGNVTSSDGLREELARTEEQLITEQQQNEYLQNRIEELESELADIGTSAGGDSESVDGTVADADLAQMEDRLRDERIETAQEQEKKVPSVSSNERTGDESP